MAATDQVYRSQKTLNLVFAVSCVFMLFTVGWMLADDYNRPHKKVQRKFRDVEAQISLAAMLDNLPEVEAVNKARDALAAARQKLADRRKELYHENSSLIATHDKAVLDTQNRKA